MKTCIFCDALKAGDDRKAAAVLLRGRRNFVMLNRYPYTPGHLMIAPKRHLADFAEGPARRRGPSWPSSSRPPSASCGAAYRPHGFNAGMNLGASAGAGVAGHYHLHVVPRWTGDSNFMPLVGGRGSSSRTWIRPTNKLRPLFDQERRRGERAEPWPSAGRDRSFEVNPCLKP